MASILAVCKARCEHEKWGKRKVCKHLLESESRVDVSETRAGHYLDKFFYDATEQALFFRSNEAHVKHRKCVTREKLVIFFRR